MKQINIPNIITLSRILLLIVSLFVIDHIAFYILYDIAGFTDMLDGWLARKLKQSSLLGARLDTFADLFLFAAMMTWISFFQFELLMNHITFLLVLFMFKLIIVLITYIKYKVIAIVHTIGNKLLGFIIFLCPFFGQFMSDAYIIVILIVAAMVIAEELSIAILKKDFDINRKSVFFT